MQTLLNAILAVPTNTGRAEWLLLRLRGQWFIRLRWVFIGLTAALLALERMLWGASARPAGLLHTLALLAAVNVIWTLIARRSADAPPLEAGADPTASAPAAADAIGRATLFSNAQVAVDLVFLTLILRFVGGASSPLAAFYVFHIAICSLLLAPANAVVQAVWAMFLYGLLVVGELTGRLPPRCGLTGDASTATGLTRTDVAAATYAVVCTAVFGILYFTQQIAAVLVQRERALYDANAALRRTEAALRRTQRLRAEFMRTAAHQLKGPLATVQTIAGLLRDGLVPAHEEAATLDRVVRRCHEGLDQVAELLALARVQDADPARHENAQADVAAALAQVRARFEPIAAARRIDLRFPPCDRLPPIRIDPRDLLDCVGNLVDNAIKYTPDGGTVTVDARYAMNEVAIRVADTGIGIADDVRSGLFEAYRRGNQAIRAGIAGTGLGLTIVDEVLGQVGGRIIVDSTVGVGTTMTLYLPVCPQSEPASECHRTADQPIAAFAPPR